jgi:hypothetical protein
VGSYAIQAAAPDGGTFDPANYLVVYVGGTLQVFAKPSPPTTPEPPLTPGEIKDIITQINQNNNSTPQSAGDQGSDEPSIISGFGIQHQNLNSFFGEQLLEPGGALMIDDSGLGPPLPIGEAPPDLENHLEEQPHEVLDEAIAEDDRKRGIPVKVRTYEVSPGQALAADASGKAGFEELTKAPAALQRATDENVESRLRRVMGL